MDDPLEEGPPPGAGLPRIVFHQPGDRIAVKIGGSTFFVRPITRQFYAEVDATLSRTFPDAVVPKSERERAIYRSLLVGFENVECNGKIVAFAEGCPLCKGKGSLSLPSIPGEPSINPPCVACLGTGDVRDFAFVCLAAPTWNRLEMEAMRQFAKEVDQAKN